MSWTHVCSLLVATLLAVQCPSRVQAGARAACTQTAAEHVASLTHIAWARVERISSRREHYRRRAYRVTTVDFVVSSNVRGALSMPTRVRYSFDNLDWKSNPISVQRGDLVLLFLRVTSDARLSVDVEDCDSPPLHTWAGVFRWQPGPDTIPLNESQLQVRAQVAQLLGLAHDTANPP